VIALDTNLLVYAHRSRTPEHLKARKAIQAAHASRDGCGIPLPCLAEFWAVVTHPESRGRASTPEEAHAFLRALTEDAGMAVWVPEAGFERRLLQVAHDLRVSGARVFDLQIAVLAVENGATEIWTHDAGFVTLPGLRKLDPL